VWNVTFRRLLARHAGELALGGFHQYAIREIALPSSSAVKIAKSSALGSASAIAGKLNSPSVALVDALPQ